VQICLHLDKTLTFKFYLYRKSDSELEDELDERLKNIAPEMIKMIRNEIMDVGKPVTWDDIAGLDSAKTTIQVL